MEDDTLIRKIRMSCPLCGKTHEVEERKRIATINLKGEDVTYKERFYFMQMLMRMRMRMNLRREQ